MSIEPTLYFAAALAAIIPALVVLIVNVVCAVIAVGMAKKRGLQPVPAFFAAFFASFIALFFIAMHPVKDI